MKRSILLPILTLAAGVAGFFLRWRELADAAVSPRGLTAPGMPSLLLAALSVLLIAALVLGCLRIAFARGYCDAFTPAAPVALVAGVVTAGLVAAAAVLSLYEFYIFLSVHGAAGLGQPGNPLVSRGVLGIAAALCCIALLRLALRLYGRSRQKGKYSISVLMPSFLCCIWLFGVYQTRASDPVLLDYIYELAGVMSCALAGYFMAGFQYEKPKPRLVIVFGLLAVYLCGVCLAETGDLIGRMLFIAMGLHLLVAVTALLRNVSKPRHVVFIPSIPEESVHEE